MNVELRIDRVVLDGFEVTADQAELIRGAIEHELMGLLGRDGLRLSLTRRVTLRELPGATFDRSGATGPHALGSGIGQALHTSLSTPVGEHGGASR